MNALKILEKTREYLTPPERWHQGAWAKTSGFEEGGTLHEAIKIQEDCPRCLLGTLAFVAQDESIVLGWPKELATNELQEAFEIQEDMFGVLLRFNDAADRQHEDVLSLLDDAIMKLRLKKKRR